MEAKIKIIMDNIAVITDKQRHELAAWMDRQRDDMLRDGKQYNRKFDTVSQIYVADGR